MSRANQVSGAPTDAPGAGTLVRRTWFVLLTLVLAAALWFVLDFPTFVQAEDAADGTALWSADLSVVELDNGAIGAIQADHFSNQGGSAGLTAKWLYYYPPERKLRLSFSDGASVEGHILQVGHFSVAFTENDSGNNSFTWDDVEVDWENGQTLAARVVPGSDGDIPATGLPTISGKAQVDETLSADTSDIADQDGLDSVSWAYQWLADDADIALATGSSYTPVAADLGKTISVKVSFTDDEGNSESLTSQPTGAVIAANTPATGAPAISGDPKVRQTLSADVTGISDGDGLTAVTYAYRWTTDDMDIDGATGSSYKLTSSEMGAAIKVVVSFKDDAGNDEVLTSAATLAVADGPPDTPTITSVQRQHIGMLKVDWDDMEGATSYELEYHQYGIDWMTLPHEPLNYDAHFNGSQALVDGLPDRAGYTFRVRAVNDAGQSEWSETYGNSYSPAELYGADQNPRPKIAGSPSKPPDLRVSGAGHLQIKVSWTKPEDSGDSDVTGYRVEFQAPNSGYWHFLAVTTETSYTHTGLSPDRTFYYRVSAFNEKGRGRNTARARGTSVAQTGTPLWEPAVHQVAEDWELLPEGVDWKHGDRFRLMFITSESRGANSTDIEEYNRFVQQVAAGGHSKIQEYSADFRVVASTIARDAKDNTGTNWSETDQELPVYWLKGTRAADNYEDFYDGDWDDPRFEPEWDWLTVIGRMTFYSFDAGRGEYVYTDEHGVSMYQRHCVGVSWLTHDLSGNLQSDPLPCIATGSLNDGTRHYSDFHERCGYYLTLGTPCAGVAFGRPTRILPEEEGHGKPTVFTDPTLAMGRRETRPAYITTQVEGAPEWSVERTNLSEGRISLTFLFYAMSPVFEVQADPALTVADAEATEGDDATLDFTVTLHPAAAAEVTVDYATQDGTATAGSDYTSTSGTLTFAAGDTTKTVSVPITDDTADDDGETFKLALSNVSGANVRDAEATGTIRNTEENTAAGGAPTITGTPQAEETLTADTSGITDANGLTNVSWQYQWLADGADIGSATGSSYTLTSSEEGQTVQVRVTFTDDADNTESLTSGATVAVAAKPNTAATGEPTISGTPQVDETLTAGTSAISDEDGLANVSYQYQWLRDDADIAGQTNSTYRLVSADQDKTIKVRVTFRDDADNAESLTSMATTAVAARPTPAVLLTASFANVPADHDGSNFTFDLNFSENVNAGYARIRDDAFTVSGGAIASASRKTQGSNQGWTVEVDPTGNGSVSITLPETTDCDATGAICTDDSRKLSHPTSATVAGPPAISVSDGNVQEAEGAVLVFTATLSRASSRTVTVGYATSDGTAVAGSDYTAASGKLTFNAGDTSQSVRVTVLTDSGGREPGNPDPDPVQPQPGHPGRRRRHRHHRERRIVFRNTGGPASRGHRPVVLLTASFGNMPATHNGSEFTFDLAFSENVQLPAT